MNIVLPTSELYKELTQHIAMLPCIFDINEVVDHAIQKHFRGLRVNLHDDPMFQAAGAGVDKDIAVGFAEQAIEIAASFLQPLFITAGIDPRTIENAKFINRDLVVVLGRSTDGSNRIAEGVTRCVVRPSRTAFK